MMELIFVIVIIGILASVALPKFGGTYEDAVIARIKSDVGAIRASIAAHYQKQILEGNNSCPPLEESTTNNQLFEEVLDYPIPKNKGQTKWDGNGTDYNVTFTANGKKIIKFHYDGPDHNCRFRCSSTDGNCSYLN